MHFQSLPRRTIREWLADRNGSVVAQSMGVNLNTIYRWRNMTAIPSGPSLLALAQYLGISSEQIILPPRVATHSRSRRQSVADQGEHGNGSSGARSTESIAQSDQDLDEQGAA